MAITLANMSAATSAASNAVTVPITASTAGNLLVAAMMQYSGTTDLWTLPANWVKANGLVASGAGGSAATDIWYYPNCAGGITSVVISFSGSGVGNYCGAVVAEFAGVLAASPLDKTGTVAGSATSTVLTATTSATLTANNELAIGAFGFNAASASKITWTQGAAFTVGANDSATKLVGHIMLDYDLDTGVSSGATYSEIGTSSVAGLAGGVIATFKAAAVAAHRQPPYRKVNQAVQRASTW